ncbi:MAG: crossover junction endodeoxyribonuclease RuvC [Chthoniobacterales bacterium]
MPAATTTTTPATRILGIDPSLRGTGYAIVTGTAKQPQVSDYGVIKVPPAYSLAACLLQIHECLDDVIKKHRPEILSIESTIYVQSFKTAITLGSARGIALLAAAKAGMQIHEYAPLKIKRALVGRGRAGKEQVAFMVRALCGLRETPPSDAADAIACAITHLNQETHARNTLAR